MFLKCSGHLSFSTQFPKYVLKAVPNEKKGPDRNQIIEEEAEASYKILNEKGYNIARRTVAKYREQLNIPVARLRKEL